MRRGVQGQGFSIDVENAGHLVRIHLWGRWNSETGTQYLQDLQQKLSRLSGTHHENWSLLLDLTGYIVPSEEMQTYIEQGFTHLKSLTVIRQAILLHGPIIHLPGPDSPQAGPLVSSYFQSEDEALEWLRGA